MVVEMLSGGKLGPSSIRRGGCSVLSSSRSVLGRGPRHAIRTSLRYRLDLFRFLVSILIGRTSNVEWLLGESRCGGLGGGPTTEPDP